MWRSQMGEVGDVGPGERPGCRASAHRRARLAHPPAANRAAALAAHPRLRPKGTEHVGSGLPLTSTPDVGLSCQISWSSLPFCSAHPSSLLRRPAQLLALRPALIVQSVLKRLPSLEP